MGTSLDTSGRVDAGACPTSTISRRRRSKSCARSSRRRAAGDALLDRQGQLGACSTSREGVLPGEAPFPLLHVDTTWKFREMYAFRDEIAAQRRRRAARPCQPEGRRAGIDPFTHGSAVHTDVMKTEALQQALDKYGFDAAIGGARRDEETLAREGADLLVPVGAAPLGPEEPAARALAALQRAQAPGRVDPRLPAVELDRARRLALHLPRADPDRAALFREGATGGRARRHADHGRRRADAARSRARSRRCEKVRFRTLGCYPLIGRGRERARRRCRRSSQEMMLATTSERQGRLIDHDSDGSMEKKKREGYF